MLLYPDVRIFWKYSLTLQDKPFFPSFGSYLGAKSD